VKVSVVTDVFIWKLHLLYHLVTVKIRRTNS